jgi:thiamine-monophosphate kinase
VNTLPWQLARVFASNRSKHNRFNSHSILARCAKHGRQARNALSEKMVPAWGSVRRAVFYLRMRSKSFRSSRPSTASELALLSRIRERAARISGSAKRGAGLRLGIGDDCALLRLRHGDELAVTTDLSIAGQHFQLNWHPPEAIGHRTLARGLSDLAAMGARPIAAFLSLGLPRELTGKWLDRFLDGFFALADASQTPLAGGDLAESPIPVADIMLTGAVRSGKALFRSGARPGDLLYVTGSLGGAATGLAQLRQLAETAPKLRAKARDFRLPRIPAELKDSLAPHLYPRPRIAQGLVLVSHALASAAIDMSDGLSTDLTHLCEESRVAAEVDLAALPIYPGATRSQALHGGEDYELLFTARPRARVPRSIAGISITRIGRILRARASEPAIMLLTPQGPQPLERQGWEHFL